MRFSKGSGLFGALVLFFAACQAAYAAIIDNSTTARNSSYYTGSLLDKSEGTALYMATNARMRINAAAAGGTYNLTMPATNYLGYLWFYAANAANTGDIDMTIDGTGRLFGQYPEYDGQILNSNEADTFTLYGFGYNLLLGFGNVSKRATAETIAFSNTIMRIVNPANNYDITLSYRNGMASFAGRSGAVANGGILAFPQQKYDGRFGLEFYDADAYIPSIRMFPRYSRCSVVVDGGSLTCNGLWAVDYDEAGRPGGTNTVEFTGGASIVQKGDMTMGTDKSVRYSEFSATGAGTRFVQTSGAFTTAGNSTLTFAGGAEAVFNTGFSLANTASSSAELRISGDGTDVSVGGSGAATAYLGNAGSCTVTMTGGRFGRADTGGELVLRMGAGAAASSTFNLAGGCFRLGSGTSRLEMGGTGNATLNMSGGEMYVGNDIRLGYLTGQMPGRTSVFRMTGGSAFVHGLVIASYADAVGRTSEVRLDGGELVCDSILAYNSTVAGKSGTAVFSADGGTVKPRQSRTNAAYPFFNAGFDVFALGDGGLVVDTDGFDIISRASMTNIDGEDGLLVKDGRGALILVPGSYDVAETRVQGGTLSVTNSAISLSTALVVTNGAVFSTVGTCGEVLLDSLEVCGGTLALDPGDVIKVSGDASFEDLRLSFSEMPALDGESACFIEVAGTLSASSAAALRSAFCENITAIGASVRVTVDTDGDTGRTTVSASYATDVPLDAGTFTEWNGTGPWGSAASWSAGVPTAEKTAAFTSPTAAKQIAAPAGAEAGAMAFGDDGYSISGGPVRVSAGQGAARIAVDEGGHEISAPVEAEGVTLGVPVASGASLTLSGALAAGGVAKSGGGRLALGAANSMTGYSTLSGGTLELAHYGAMAGTKRILASEGTLAVNASGAAADLSGADVYVEASSSPVIIDAASDVTLGDLAVTGRLVKRGAGKVTVDASLASAVPRLTTAKGTGVNGYPGTTANMSFAADGSVSPAGCGGLTVAEGELVLRNGSFSAQGSVVVGVNMASVASQAKLVLDNATLDAIVSATHFFIGSGTALAGSQQTAPSLVLLNGSLLKVDTLQNNIANQNNYGRSILAATNSTLYCSFSYNMADTSTPRCPAFVRMRDSNLWIGSTGGISMNGSFDAVFDNCVIERTTAAGVPAGRSKFFIKTYNTSFPTGTVAFVNGTVARLGSFDNFGPSYTGSGISLVWNGAQWDYGDGDYTFESFDNPKITFEMKGDGVILAPADDTTFTARQAFTGTGGMVKRGAGTVAFDAGAYAFSGVCAVEEGTVDLSSAGRLAGASFAGAGTVSGASLESPRIVLESDDDWSGFDVPTFENCTVSGRACFDFGRTAESPLSAKRPAAPMVVARFTGSVPDVSSWRISGTGLGRMRGRFQVDGSGQVLLSVEESGFSLIVR